MSPDTRRITLQIGCLVLAVALGSGAALLSLHMHWYSCLMILVAGCLWGFWCGYQFRDQHQPPTPAERF